MSRSFKKTPVFPITMARSEKQDKRRWNKTYRRVARKLLRLHQEVPVKIQAVSNVWEGDKDGKHYLRNYEAQRMRK